MPSKITTIRGFKGISQSLALTSGSPDYALDCVNVIPSAAGLAKLRAPIPLSEPPDEHATGPDQFGMFSAGSTRSVLAFFGEDIYVIHLDSFIPRIYDSNPAYVGRAPWSVIMSNDHAFLQNGVAPPLKYRGGPTLNYWGIQQATPPVVGGVSGTGITLIQGRTYRVSYKSADNVVGTASAPSASTGPIANQTQALIIPAPATPDGQIDRARLYATLDGASDFFFHSEVLGPFPIVVADHTPDSELDQSERAPLINDQPPIAVYTCLWGGRIFMFNLPRENPKWVAYTGYNRIFVGRPEETCPPGNRVKLETGADVIAGGGVIAAGLIVFDRANQMFMFRGQPEDITVTAPVEFTLFLKQLPWNLGCAGHFTIQSTDRGLVWLTPTLDVMLFDGYKQPTSLGEGVQPILRTINPLAMQNGRSVIWQYKGRNWYVLAVPITPSLVLTKLLIFDLEANSEQNVGVVPFDVGAFESLGVVEMTDGSQKLVIGQGGALKELTVTPTTINGIEIVVNPTAGTLGAYWQSGYIGNEAPELEKFFREARITSDQAGIRVKRRLIGDDITKPRILEFIDVPEGGKLTTNKKARLLSYELRFRDEDTPQNILQVLDRYIPLAER